VKAKNCFFRALCYVLIEVARAHHAMFIRKDLFSAASSPWDFVVLHFLLADVKEFLCTLFREFKQSQKKLASLPEGSF
jgi:hypothetical protein